MSRRDTCSRSGGSRLRLRILVLPPKAAAATLTYWDRLKVEIKIQGLTELSSHKAERMWAAVGDVLSLSVGYHSCCCGAESGDGA